MATTSQRAVGALVVGRFSSDERRMLHWIIYSKGKLSWREVHEALGRDIRSPKLYVALKALRESNVVVETEPGEYALAEPDQWDDRFDDAAAALVSRASRNKEARVKASAAPAAPKVKYQCGPDGRERCVAPRYRSDAYMGALGRASEAAASPPPPKASAPTMKDVGDQFEAVFGLADAVRFEHQKAALAVEFRDALDCLTAAIRKGMCSPERISRPVTWVVKVARSFRETEIPASLRGASTPFHPWGVKPSQRVDVEVFSAVDLIGADSAPPPVRRTPWGDVRSQRDAQRREASRHG